MTASLRRSLLCVIGSLALAAVLVVAGCDTSVDAVVENDQSFSVYALLDAAADTQVVRVERLRDSVLVGAPRELDATVTLTNLATDETVTLRDSFATLRPNLQTHLFWAPTGVEPNTEYRVRVEGGNGDVSTATATVPSSPPTLQKNRSARMPCDRDVRGQGKEEHQFTVTASGVDRLAGFRAMYFVGGASYAFGHSEGSRQAGGSRVRTIIIHEDDLERIGGRCGTCPCRGRFDRPVVDVVAATAGPEGPPLQGLTLQQVAKLDTVSNVEGGAGFVGGMYSDTLRVPLIWGN